MLEEDLDYIQRVVELSKYEEEIERLVKANPSSTLLQAFQVLMQRTNQQVCTFVSITCEKLLKIVCRVE